MTMRSLWLALAFVLGAAVSAEATTCPNVATVNVAVDGYGGECIAGFAPNGNYASPLSVTTGGAEVALPAGVLVAASNPGSNPEWVNLGTSSGVTATTADIMIPAGCTVPLAASANTYIAAISTGGSTTLNLAAGSGFFAPFCAGGSGGGGGGSVTQGTNPWVTSPAALTPVTASTSLSSSQVLKSSAGTFFGAQVNTTTAAVFVMLFNATSLPSNGAVTPIGWWQVPANSTASIAEAPAASMGAGITLGCSTTGPFTLTATSTCTFAMGMVQ
jgi:hypothetical protein